jgi:hypothetical protein
MRTRGVRVPQHWNQEGASQAHVRCARCGYLLTGLPMHRACPECGTPSDNSTQTITLTPQTRHYRTLGFAVLLFCIVYTTARRHSDIPEMPSLRELGWWAAIILGFVIIVVVRLFKDAGKAHLLTLSDEGVRFESPLFPSAVFPWETVKQARYRWTSDTFLLLGRDGSGLFKCGSCMLGSRRTVRRCVSEINRFVSMYSTVSCPESRLVDGVQ